MIKINARQQNILARLRQHEDIQIDTIAEYFQVTTQTVRRDVNQLCKAGYARRIHGGVGLPVLLTNTSYQLRSDLQFNVKDTIAKKVADSIPDGATIMMGIGTTVTRIAYYLKTKNRVITNNLQVVKILESNPEIEVYIAGGLFRSQQQDVVGHSVLTFFNSFEADIGILGCAAITESHTAMEHETAEAELSQSILHNSRQTWLVADASKWSGSASVKIASLATFDQIYTNQTNLPQDLPITAIE
ncbi:DeoR/GlpR family DNA-binding transcription regulator [Psychromonas sp. SA13A]|uniref:DeoR/GlpR family DNA-binding transcription regulator n=1 Tax=Psychromonas sp. SA13A TaxID=2686346 RepID=UPI001981FA62|nr:DeoR/GlpR family DNA-binding transcription regulator [Psychromonas sp. SA13A]